MHRKAAVLRHGCFLQISCRSQVEVMLMEALREYVLDL